MGRYILLQYEHGQVRHKHSNVVGTYGELETAQVAAQARLHDINEIIDRDTWHIVWSAVRACPQLDYNLAVLSTDVPFQSQ
jgi:hypothetical protein